MTPAIFLDPNHIELSLENLDINSSPGESHTVRVELIRERLKGGFRPFAIVMSSGDKYPVPHPEFILLTPRTVVVADRRGYTTNLDPLHIVSLEEVPSPRNGKTKRGTKH